MSYMMDRGCYNQSCNVQAGYLNSIVIVNEMAGLTTLVSVAKAEIEEVAPQLANIWLPIMDRSLSTVYQHNE